MTATVSAKCSHDIYISQTLHNEGASHSDFDFVAVVGRRLPRL